MLLKIKFVLQKREREIQHKVLFSNDHKMQHSAATSFVHIEHRFSEKSLRSMITVDKRLYPFLLSHSFSVYRITITTPAETMKML